MHYLAPWWDKFQHRWKSPQYQHILKLLNQQDQMNYWSTLKLLSNIEHFAHVKPTYTRITAAKQWLLHQPKDWLFLYIQADTLVSLGYLETQRNTKCLAFGFRAKTLKMKYLFICMFTKHFFSIWYEDVPCNVILRNSLSLSFNTKFVFKKSV